jgi:hypothetical protein
MRHYFVAFVLALLGATAWAQAAGESVAVSKVTVVDNVAVDKLVLFSRPVFGFRGSFMGVSARDPARWPLPWRVPLCTALSFGWC